MKKLTRLVSAAALGVMLSVGSLVAQTVTVIREVTVTVIRNPDGSTTTITTVREITVVSKAAE